MTVIFQMVEDYADAFDRLLEALIMISQRLPMLELYTEAFNSSKLIHGPVYHAYLSMIRFWSQALKFYNRNHSSGFFKSPWSNYHTEFKDLEDKMDRQFRLVTEYADALGAHRARAQGDNVKGM